MKSPITRETLPALRQDTVFGEKLCGKPLTFHTTWGLFSPREVDAGTRLLLEHIELSGTARVLDLGCGYGALGLALAAAESERQVTLVDKDFVAVEYCRKNATNNGLSNTRVLLSNGMAQVEESDFDCVVTNLPAKSGKELYYLMFYDVYDSLQSGGQFYIVTINGLRGFVKRVFNEVFGNYRKLKQGSVYTVAVATKS
ncbi:MAG: methyltransferase [Pseudomonadota bacterium]